MVTLRLAVGYEDFTFPGEDRFGEYKGRSVCISYSFTVAGEKIRAGSKDGPELEGAAREFVKEQLRPDTRIERDVQIFTNEH